MRGSLYDHSVHESRPDFDRFRPVGPKPFIPTLYAGPDMNPKMGAGSPWGHIPLSLLRSLP
jgi:hypothetical protein